MEHKMSNNNPCKEKLWNWFFWVLAATLASCLVYFSNSATQKIVAHQEQAIEQVQAQTQNLIADAVANLTVAAAAELRQVTAIAEHQIQTSGALVSTSLGEAIAAFLAINNGPVGLILEKDDGELYLTDASEKIEMMAPADAYPVLAEISDRYRITDGPYNIFVDFSAVTNGKRVKARLVVPKEVKEKE